jgi:hypothetical protein
MVPLTRWHSADIENVARGGQPPVAVERGGPAAQALFPTGTLLAYLVANFRHSDRNGCLVTIAIGSTNMLNLDQIRNDRNLVNAIDWEMTPEEAVRLYLEWGNNWARGNYVIRSKDDVSHYFVVNTWKEEPVIYFIRRNSDEAVELAKIEMPEELKRRFLRSQGRHKGVWALDGEVKSWLQNRLNAH